MYYWFYYIIHYMSGATQSGRQGGGTGTSLIVVRAQRYSGRDGRRQSSQCGADLFSITNSQPAYQLHSHSHKSQSGQTKSTPPPPSYVGVFPYHVIITVMLQNVSYPDLLIA